MNPSPEAHFAIRATRTALVSSLQSTRVQHGLAPSRMRREHARWRPHAEACPSLWATFRDGSGQDDAAKVAPLSDALFDPLEKVGLDVPPASNFTELYRACKQHLQAQCTFQQDPVSEKIEERRPVARQQVDEPYDSRSRRTVLCPARA